MMTESCKATTQRRVSPDQACALWGLLEVAAELDPDHIAALCEGLRRRRNWQVSSERAALLHELLEGIADLNVGVLRGLNVAVKFLRAVGFTTPCVRTEE